MATVTGLEPPQHVAVDTVELRQLQAKEKYDDGQLVSRGHMYMYCHLDYNSLSNKAIVLLRMLQRCSLSVSGLIVIKMLLARFEISVPRSC